MNFRVEIKYWPGRSAKACNQIHIWSKAFQARDEHRCLLKAGRDFYKAVPKDALVLDIGITGGVDAAELSNTARDEILPHKGISSR